MKIEKRNVIYFYFHLYVTSALQLPLVYLSNTLYYILLCIRKLLCWSSLTLQEYWEISLHFYSCSLSCKIGLLPKGN